MNKHRFMYYSWLAFFVFFMSLTMEVKVFGKDINYSKKTLYTAQTVKLKVNNSKNVKWSSSNNKIAKVSKQGKVKALKTGKATITARVGKKKYKCKIQVKKYSLDKMEKKVNEFFSASKDYNTFFVASDISPHKEKGHYIYYIRSSGANVANVLVGRLEVNPDTGKGVLDFEFGDKVKVNILK